MENTVILHLLSLVRMMTIALTELLLLLFLHPNTSLISFPQLPAILFLPLSLAATLVTLPPHSASSLDSPFASRTLSCATDYSPRLCQEPVRIQVDVDCSVRLLMGPVVDRLERRNQHLY